MKALVPSTSEYLEKLWHNAPKDVLNLRGSMQFGDEYKYVTASFDTKDYPERARNHSHHRLPVRTPSLQRSCVYHVP